MNLPNKLTLTRILLVPVFMIFVSLGQYITPSYNPRYYLIAGLIFAVASFTDFLDGHLARKWNMVTDFGKFADPLADKLLTTVAFIYMMRDGVCRRCKGRQGHRRQHVGQGEDRAPDADHPLLLLHGLPDRQCAGPAVCRHRLRAVLGRGRCHCYLRHQVPVG